MDLFNYYSLDECSDLKSVKNKLEQLEEEGKIEYSIEGEILKLRDLDLDDFEITDLVNLLDKTDVLPYPDYEDGEDDMYDDEYDDYNKSDDF